MPKLVIPAFHLFVRARMDFSKKTPAQRTVFIHSVDWLSSNNVCPKTNLNRVGDCVPAHDGNEHGECHDDKVHIEAEWDKE